MMKIQPPLEELLEKVDWSELLIQPAHGGGYLVWLDENTPLVDTTGTYGATLREAVNNAFERFGLI